MKIAHPSRFDDWALGVKQVNPIPYYWTRVYVVLMAAGPIVALYEGTMPLPLPLVLGSVVALVGMLRVGAKYDGIVKAMAVPHAIGVGVATAVMAQWVFVNGVVTLDASPITYRWACLTIPFCSAMTIIDVYDTVEWCVWKTHKVTRSRETVSNYVKKGRLPADTENVQWLMKGGTVVNEQCNEYGFLLTDCTRGIE